MTKNKCAIVREKLSLPNTKEHEAVSITTIKNNNKNNNHNHKKIAQKKNLNNINILEYNHYNEEVEKNIYNYTNTASNRINIHQQNSINENDLLNSNNNIHKSISLVAINNRVAYKTQTNNINYNINFKKNSNDESHDKSDNIHCKISTFKFDEFKKKKLKKSNTNNIIVLHFKYFF